MDSGSRRSNCSLQQAEQVDPSLNLAMEADRLLTFDEKWDNQNIETAELAHWGWFYTGTRDLVKTFCCGIRLQDWVSGDKPFEWHKIKKPTCPFILGVTAAAEENSQGIQPPSPRVSCAVFGVKSTKTADNWDAEENHESETLLARLGVFVQKPRHTQYVTYQSRVSSFERWPRTKTQTAEDLGNAGFFFTGLVDRVLCFHCNLTFHNWQPNMIPWEEHFKWAGSRCEYLNMCSRETCNLETLQGGSSGTSRQDDGPVDTDDNVNEELVAAVEETLLAHTIEELEYKIPSWKGHENVRTMMDMGYDKTVIAQAVITNHFQIFDDIDNFVERTEFLLSMHNRANHRGQSSGALRNNTKLSANAQRQNREAQICKICYDSELCIAFLPCSHLVCCTKCSPALTQCPICRKEAAARVRVYLT